VRAGGADEASAVENSGIGVWTDPYAYRVHFQISLNVGFLPYIRMPTR
jgi:hypothetical protein